MAAGYIYKDGKFDPVGAMDIPEVMNRLNDLESDNATQDAAITALEKANTTQTTEINNLKSANATQDAAITALETAAPNYISRLTTYYSGSNEATADEVLEGSILMSGAKAGISDESFVYIIQLFYGLAGATQRHMQLAIGYTTGKVYTRVYNGSDEGWTAWKQLAFDADVITGAGTGLTKSGNNLALATVVTAGNAGPTANATPAFGATFTVPYITYDAYGRVTGRTNRTVKIPALPSISGNPAGTVIAFAANATPSGYLLCNGAKVSRTTYADLFAKIGTTYGTGDGSTTFTLPNLANRFIMGHGTAGTVKAAGLPNVLATLRFFSDTNEATGFASTTTLADAYWNKNGDAYMGVWTRTTLDLSKSNIIYGTSTTVQPPALTMRYYIKY